MIRSAFALSLASLVLGLATFAGCAPPSASNRATAIADQVMQGLGGKPRWDAIRGIRWSFGAEVGDTVKNIRHHSWDKQTGWHRVEGKTRAGDAFVFIDNLRDSTGKAWMNGQPIEGDSLKKLLRRAHSLWTNDTYWMLMPYKLRDPGVRLTYDGEVKEGGKDFDKLALAFEHVGETPGDHYWVWVDRANHRVEKWDMVLEGDQPPPVSYSWDGWQEHGGLWFATAHRRDDLNVFTRDIEIVTEFRPGEFTAP